MENEISPIYLNMETEVLLLGEIFFFQHKRSLLNATKLYYVVIVYYSIQIVYFKVVGQGDSVDGVIVLYTKGSIPSQGM